MGLAKGIVEVTHEIELAPSELAEAFWSMDTWAQAEFVHELAKQRTRAELVFHASELGAELETGAGADFIRAIAGALQ